MEVACNEDFIERASVCCVTSPQGNEGVHPFHFKLSKRKSKNLTLGNQAVVDLL